MKRVLSLFLIILIISCNRYSKSEYPQSVIANTPYTHIMRYHQLEVDSLNAIPKNIRDKITQHLKSKLGTEKYSQISWESIDIYSNKPIPIEKSRSMVNVILYGNDSITQPTGNGIDSIYNYPLYSTVIKLQVPEIGIKELRLELVIDKEAEIIKDIEYPENGFDDFIPIDSVHSELIRKRISSKKLNIHLNYDEKKEVFIWSTNTLIREGSILGPSCFPEVKHHFKINAQTGEITEFNSNNSEEYLEEIY